MTNRQRNNFIILMLLLALTFMGVGYSLLSESLNVSGITTIVPTNNINVSFSSITYSLTEGAININEPSIDGTKVNFNVEFRAPGSLASYRITLTNNSDTDIKVTDIISTTPSSPFKFEIFNIAVGDVIEKNTSKEINVSIGWDELVTEVGGQVITDNFGLDLRYIAVQ